MTGGAPGAADTTTRSASALRISVFLARHGSLIVAFAMRDFRTRYRSSTLGWAWSLIQPLALLGIYAVVFSEVFRVAAPRLGSGSQSYVLFLFTGLVAFNLFAGLLNLSMQGLRASGELLRKVSFPAYAPVLGSSLVQLVQASLELGVLLICFLVVGNVGVTWVLAPVFLIGLALMAQGVGLVLASANARYGDVAFLVSVALSALYFLTPILYPRSAVPDSLPGVDVFIEHHPLTWYVEGLHDSLYLLQWPSLLHTVGSLAFGVACFVGGLWIFERTTEDIGELL